MLGVLVRLATTCFVLAVAPIPTPAAERSGWTP
jgi:hypothetical protein